MFESLTFYLLDLFGCAVFAISGVLVAGKIKMDHFGVIVLASVTAIGGGTLRDIILGATPVFWVQDPIYLTVIILTAITVMMATRHIHKLPSIFLPTADAFGLALFTVIGVQKALNYGVPEMAAVVMGVMTGVAGGLIRDLLSGEVPMILRQEIYATASIAGGICYTLLLYLGLTQSLAIVLAMLSTLCIRLAAIYWHLSLPVYQLPINKDDF